MLVEKRKEKKVHKNKIKKISLWLRQLSEFGKEIKDWMSVWPKQSVIRPSKKMENMWVNRERAIFRENLS